jgi:hypothetical protein
MKRVLHQFKLAGVLSYALILGLILVTVPAHAQQSIGGVHAPDAITLQIVQVKDVSEAAREVKEGIFDSVWGNEVVAESSTAIYRLRCAVQYEHMRAGTGPGLDTIDGSFLPTFEPKCAGEFHVGDKVTFYSLDDLVWLSISRGHSVFTHNVCWKADKDDGGPYLSLVCDLGYTPPGYTAPVTAKWFAKPYSIVSEEAKTRQPRLRTR